MRRLALLAAVVLALSAGTASALPIPPVPPGAHFGGPSINNAQVTGTNSPNRSEVTAQVKGTDLGIMVEGPEGDVLMFFGDTFGPGWGGHGSAGTPEQHGWRSQTLARSSDDNLADGLAIHSWSRDGGELLHSAKGGNEVTVIPTGAVVVGERVWASLMSVRFWGPQAGQWTTNYNGLAYSDNNGETWQWAYGTGWWNDGAGSSNFQMATLERRGDYIYIFGTPAGRGGHVRVARQAVSQWPNMATVEYWNGSTWIAGNPSAAAPTVHSGELCVKYSEYLGRWVMLSTVCGSGGTGACEGWMRTAANPQGPWSAHTVVATAAAHPGFYAPYIHPRSAANPNEDDLYYVYSLWGPYQVYLAKTDLDGAP